MIFPDTIKLIFIILSLVLISFLIALVRYMEKNKVKNRHFLSCPIVIGIVSILCYCLFLMAGNHFTAVFFDSLFFMGTDWLAMSMYLLAIVYTGITRKHFKKIATIFTVLCGIDSISLLSNNITHRLFDLELRTTTKLIQMDFWANEFYAAHYVHLGICYVMVTLTLLYFILATYKAASMYKRKYVDILAAYVIVIIANMTCYTLNLPIDFSVILYGVLAGFICYYLNFSFPHKLLKMILASVNETISDGAIYFDFAGNCIYSNKAAQEIFTENGEKYSKLNVENYLEKLLKTETSDEIRYETFKSSSGDRIFEVQCQTEVVDGTAVGYNIRLIDKTQEQTTIKNQKYIATHDELTDILNRNGFFEAVDEIVEKEGAKGRLMVCSNIKDFKLINQMFGEKFGDEVLCRQADILKKYSHSDTIYGRIGDDRFALFLKQVRYDEKNLLGFIQKVQHITDSNVYNMHIHAGVYKVLDDKETARSMCDKAIMAITTIKDSYTQVFSYYDSALMERLLIEKNTIDDFENALSLGQIKMYLQPIIDSKNNSFGAEALCRWEHPLRGLLLPTDFLDILEDSGLIFQLDEFIWKKAAEKLSEWNQKGCKDSYISVNVSVKDFYYTDIYKTFTRLVETYDINPQNFHIEITESVLMNNFKQAYEISEKLRKFGFIVAIDNFGNGYSSLNMLKDFKTDVLKIDMSLLTNNSELSRNQVIIASIIEMAHALNITVIGEGVETKDQYDMMRKFDCNIFQGHCISEAMSIEEYEDKFVKFFYD